MLCSGASAGGLLEAIAVAIHGQDADVVSEPLRSQNLPPALEWPIGGDDSRAAFVALGESLEQEFGLSLADPA